MHGLVTVIRNQVQGRFSLQMPVAPRTSPFARVFYFQPSLPVATAVAELESADAGADRAVDSRRTCQWARLGS